VRGGVAILPPISPQKKKIAILAVHGVADQQPGDSIRQVSNILLDFNGDDAYETPVERKLRIHLKPAIEGEENEPRTLFAEANQYLRRGRQEGNREEDPSLEFMREQLRYYHPEGQEPAFETSRLETGIAGAAVHIYEGYWADLSRLGRGLTTFFGEAYQLLLHLPSLGRTAVDYAGLVSGWARPWRLFSFMQRWSVRLLTLFIATWTLDLTSFILPALVSFLDARSIIVAAQLIVCLAAVAAVGLVLRGVRDVPGWLWIGGPIAAAVVTGFLVRPYQSIQFAVVVAWFISAAVIAIVLKAFDRARPGAFIIGSIGLAVALIAMIWHLPSTLRAFEVVNDGCRLFWAIHMVWMIAAMAVGWLCVAMSNSEARERTLHTAWTAQTTISLSTLLFANLNLVFWAAVLTVIGRFFPKEQRDFAWGALRHNASTAFVTITVAFALFCAMFVWSIFPSVIAEVRPAAEQSKDDRRVVALGRWLTRGFNLIPIGGWFLGFTVIVVFVVAAVQLFSSQVILKIFGIDPLKAVTAAGSLLIVLISARFWLPGAASALDVMLDVDNYLREHPRRSTPRARIAERMTSLLRFLADEQYDAVVIIAHSQGSVIVADLLRFLAVFDPQLIGHFEGKLRLFTMGCPLRQLYARAFPGLYGWMDPRPSAPDPAALHLARWVNHYRSGDYVGRWLWRGEDDPNIWTLTPYLDGAREESCIGAGAHTHYWDWSSAAIGARLGALVREAVS